MKPACSRCIKRSQKSSRNCQTIGAIDTAELEAWVTRIEKLHMQVLLGNKVEVHLGGAVVGSRGGSWCCCQCQQRAVGSGETNSRRAVVYHTRENTERLRCRLILKSTDGERLLFANVLGAKCMEKTLEEFAYLFDG